MWLHLIYVQCERHSVWLKVEFLTVTSWLTRWRLKSTASRLFSQRFIQAQIKENTKAPRHWPLCGEFTCDWWIPLTNGQWRGKWFRLMTSSCKDEIPWKEAAYPSVFTMTFIWHKQMISTSEEQGASVEVWEWITYFIPPFVMYVITNPCSCRST